MFKILLKKQLSEIFKGYFYDAKKNRMRSAGTIALLFVLFAFLIIVVLGGMFLALSFSLCAGLTGAGAGWLYFAIMSACAILFGAFGAVFNSYAMLYLAKDNELLLSLPIPSRDIIASRLVIVYILGAMYSLIVMIPAQVVYVIFAQPGVVTVLCGILLMVIVTVIVLCLSCIFGWIVAKISKKLKNKSLVTVFITIAFIALYYVAYFRAEILIKELILNAAIYGAKVKGAAFGIYLFGSIGEGNIQATLLFLAITAVLLLLTWRVMSRSFLSLVTASQASKKTRYVEKAARIRSPFHALLSKEFARFLSSPSYMLNCGLGILFMVLVGIATLLNGQSINAALPQVFKGDLEGICVLLCGALCLLSASNDIAAPSVSLEGKSVWLLQSLPIAPKTVLRSKAAVHFILTAVPLAFAVASLAITVDLPLIPKVLMCLLPFVCTAFTTMTASWLGVRMANVNWTNEIIPIKRSGAVTIELFGGWGIAILFIVLYLILRSLVDATLYMVVWMMLFAVVSILLLRWLDTRGSQLFAEL